MSSELVINVAGVSKCYESYHKPIYRLWQSLFGNKRRKFYSEFWALKNINLTVSKGETVGIVGKNGSGKSTLLQIVSGILQPSAGTVSTNGRVSALLELGAGFNPEFTGMENARLNASIMGLSREEFHQKLPDIVEFSGLDEFLNRPIKTYSSGMFVRLAFAVAINMNPDVLIIDEALAVGDVRFQRKCYRRLDQLKESGVSILLVTHSTDSVIKYCDRAIMLDSGEMKIVGSPKDVVQAYLEMMFDSDHQTGNGQVTKQENYALDFDPTQDNCVTQATYNDGEHRWGDARAKICHYDISANGQICNRLIRCGDEISIRAAVLFEYGVEDLIYGITLKTHDGNAVYGTNSRIGGNVPNSQQAGDLIFVEFKFIANLLAGDYFVSLGVAQDHNVKDNVAIDRRYDMIHLHVAQTPEAFGFAALNGEINLVE